MKEFKEFHLEKEVELLNDVNESLVGKFVAAAKRAASSVKGIVLSI